MTNPRHAALRVAAIATLGAGVIHLAVVEDHARTWWVSGVFFALLAACQLGWGLAGLARPRLLDPGRTVGRALLLFAVLVNAGSALLWMVTRWITGEPFGPNAGTQLPVGPAGIASTVLEGLALVALLVGPRLHARPARGLVPALVAAGLVLAAPTAWGVAGSMAHDHSAHSDSEGHHEGGHDDGHDDGHDGGDHGGGGAHRDADDAGTPDKQKPSPAPGGTSQKPTPKQSSDDHGDDGHAH